MSLKFIKPLFDSWPWHLDGANIEQNGIFLSNILGFVALLWFVWIFIDKSKKGQPPLPPGPKALPLVGNLLSLDPELHTYFASLSQTYGPICRLWLGKKVGIIITSPALAREVLREQDTIFANRDVPAAAREFSYGGKDIVWTPYGPKWRMLRKISVHEMLNGSTLDSVYELRRREFRQTVNYLYNQAGSPVSIGEQMFLNVLNVITSMLWGDTVKGEERASLGAEFRLVVTGMTELLGTPDVSDFYPGLARFDLQGVTKKMKVLAKRFDKIFETIIDQRRKMDRDGGMGSGVGQESKDFLQVLLKLKDDADAKIPLTMSELKALLMDMVVGGTDTTSNTVEFAMAEIMNNQKVLRKLQQELETVVGKDNIVEESHIQHLPYLYAVMKEVLRIHPVLPLLVPHCPSETVTVGGYTVPKGSRVFINVWAIQRDPSIWENPTEFHPERFLDNKLDYSGNDFNFIPFSSGRRMCAGIAMAERMFMYSLASLIHSFDWKLPEGEIVDLTEKFGIVLKKKIPLVAIPTPRLSSPTLYEYYPFNCVPDNYMVQKDINIPQKTEPRLPPGPRGLPIVGFLPFLRPNLHHQLTELSQQYGPIYKFWLGSKLCIVLNSPSLAKEVVRDQDSVFANRDSSIAGLLATYGGLDIAFSPYGSYWRDMRKLFVSEMLSNRNLEACYSLRKHEVRKTIRNVHTKIGYPIDIGELAFVTEMNVVMSMIFGSNFVEEKEKHAKDGAEFRELVTKFLQMLVKPNISDFFPMLARFDLQGIQKEMKALSKSVESILDPAINERMKMLSDKREGDIQGNGKKDFVQILLELMEQKNIGISVDLVQIKAILLDFVIGGTDTTITMIEWVMAELLNNPDVMTKVQKELKNVVGMNNIAEESHLPKLHYLDAVVKETLRLHPALPLLFPKRPSQSAIVGGYKIPEGTKVLLNVYAIHRDPQIWENPLKFQPVRFLSHSTNLDYAGNNMKYLPFGSGRRVCAGLPLAEKMLMFILASLLHSFDWKLPEGENVDLSDGFGLVVKKSKRLFAIPTPRLSNLELYQ